MFAYWKGEEDSIPGIGYVRPRRRRGDFKRKEGLAKWIFPLSSELNTLVRYFLFNRVVQILVN